VTHPEESKLPLVGVAESITETIAVIDKYGKSIALVVDEECHLLGTVTDGDIRRAILAGIDLGLPIRILLERLSLRPSREPIVAPVGSDRTMLLRLMKERDIRQMPLLDKERRVVDLVTLDELLPEKELPIQAVIMAGGFGERLRPLTQDVPKPMLPVGDQPLMELIIEQLKRAGIQKVNISTHYLSEKITSHFGDGRDFGIALNYVEEDQPIGTAGALGLFGSPTEPMLVINDDILTGVDFQAMHTFHREHHADLTMAVRQYAMRVPFGVVKCEGVYVRELDEKPQSNFFVDAGIYLLEPSVHRYISNGERLDMTDLIARLLSDGRLVVGFPIREYWLDVGQPEDCKQAQQDIKEGLIAS
jgi:dTDP-glucose pyrophosphorylase/CBS domain-containing protein